jgi:hypothetical protein
MRKSKQPRGPPMTLGNMRELGVNRLLVSRPNPDATTPPGILGRRLVGKADSSRTSRHVRKCQLQSLVTSPIVAA